MSALYRSQNRISRFLPRITQAVSPAVHSLMESIKVAALPKTPAVTAVCQICYKENQKGARCDQCGTPNPSLA